SAKEFYLTRTLYNSGHPFSAWEDGTANVQCLGEFFNMNRDSGLFRENSSQDSVRVYEAKCIHQFDHRYSEFSGSDYNDSKSETKADPDYVIRTHYYVNSDDYYRRCDRTGVADRGLIGW